MCSQECIACIYNNQNKIPKNNHKPGTIAQTKANLYRTITINSHNTKNHHKYKNQCINILNIMSQTLTTSYILLVCTPMKHTEKHACSCKPECMSVRSSCKQRYTYTVYVNHDTHGSRLMCCMYMLALNVHFYVINLSCAQKLCHEHFQKNV